MYPNVVYVKTTNDNIRKILNSWRYRQTNFQAKTIDPTERAFSYFMPRLLRVDEGIVFVN